MSILSLVEILRYELYSSIVYDMKYCCVGRIGTCFTVARNITDTHIHTCARIRILQITKKKKKKKKTENTIVERLPICIDVVVHTYTLCFVVQYKCTRALSSRSLYSFWSYLPFFLSFCSCRCLPHRHNICTTIRSMYVNATNLFIRLQWRAHSRIYFQCNCVRVCAYVCV